MNTCNYMRNLFTDALLGELDCERKAALDGHLAGCAACARELERARALVNLMQDYSRPEPDEGYWNRWQETLERRLASTVIPVPPDTCPMSPRLELCTTRGPRQHHRISWDGAAPRLWKLTAAAAFLILAFGIGWLVFSSGGRPVSRVVETKPALTSTPVEIEARRYLDRSKLVLLGMLAFDPAEADEFRPSFKRESEISRQLIRESASLKEQLTSSNQIRLSGLVNDLDVVLLQIANLESGYEPRELELIQNSMERKSLLFKINLEDMLSSMDDTMSSTYEPRSVNTHL